VKQDCERTRVKNDAVRLTAIALRFLSIFRKSGQTNNEGYD
jgi:hypothetical protein